MSGGDTGSYNWAIMDRKRQLLAADPHCVYCQVRLCDRTATIDHLIPVGRGGTDNRHNLVLACRPCNDDKGSLLPLEFIQRRGSPVRLRPDQDSYQTDRSTVGSHRRYPYRLTVDGVERPFALESPRAGLELTRERVLQLARRALGRIDGKSGSGREAVRLVLKPVSRSQP